MSRIEGITPPKKHKTVTQRRGEFSPHAKITAEARQTEFKILLIAVVSLVVLAVVWVLLLSRGALFSASRTDRTFLDTLDEKFSTDFKVRPIQTNANQDTLYPSP